MSASSSIVAGFALCCGGGATAGADHAWIARDDLLVNGRPHNRPEKLIRMRSPGWSVGAQLGEPCADRRGRDHVDPYLSKSWLDQVGEQPRVVRSGPRFESPGGEPPGRVLGEGGRQPGQPGSGAVLWGEPVVGLEQTALSVEPRDGIVLALERCRWRSATGCRGRRIRLATGPKASAECARTIGAHEWSTTRSPAEPDNIRTTCLPISAHSCIYSLPGKEAQHPWSAGHLSAENLTPVVVRDLIQILSPLL